MFFLFTFSNKEVWEMLDECMVSYSEEKEDNVKNELLMTESDHNSSTESGTNECDEEVNGEIEEENSCQH
jgi:hypothetical protein